MTFIRIQLLLGVIISTLLAAPSSGLAAPLILQEESSTEEEKLKAAKREKKAESLHEQSIHHMDLKKFSDARETLKELRDQLRNTIYFLRNSEDISDRYLLCGTRIAVDRLEKQKYYRKAHLDTWHGIRFLPPEGWRGIPPAQRYFGDMGTSEVDYSGQHIRITRYTSPYLENLHMMVFKLYDTKSLGHLEDTVLRKMGEYYSGLSVKSHDMLKTRFRNQAVSRKTLQDKDGNRLVFYHFYGERKGFTLVGVWRAEPDGVIYVSSSRRKFEVKESDWKKALEVFDETAKRFWIMPQAQHSAEKRRTRNGVELPGWKTIKTRNYIIAYSTRDEYAKRLGKHIERIRRFYLQVIPTGKGIPKCHIKLFDNEEDFYYYGQIPGAAAYWSPAQEEMVAYRFSGDKLKLHDEEMTVSADRNPEEETFHIMNHEGFHQYMYYLMGRARGVYIPSWLNEGMGDYFFGGTWKKKKGRLTFAIEPNWWRLDTIIEAVKEDRHVPLREIFRYTQASYYSNPELCYAEGWAICYFFLTSPEAKKRGYHRIPGQMIHALQTSGNWEKATDKILSRYNLEQMEKEWKVFVLSLEK